jgi:hypothetical protein
MVIITVLLSLHFLHPILFLLLLSSSSSSSYHHSITDLN